MTGSQHAQQQQQQQQQQLNPNADLPPHSTDVDEECRRVVQALEAIFSADASASAAGAATTGSGGADANNSSTSTTNLAGSRDVANRYLTSFQRQAVAWMVCDRLLAPDVTPIDPTNPAAQAARVQSQFFAAQTLHTKCRTDVVQLPPESLPSLRDSLMNHLTNASRSSTAGGGFGGNRALVTRLAMASAALAVQMGWNTVIEDVLGGVVGIKDDQPQDAPARPELVPAALELFKLLPEETCSDRLILADEGRRAQFGRQLEDSSGRMMAFLLRTARTNAERGPAAEDMSVAETVLHTLHSWVRYVRFHPRMLEGSPLVEWTFHVLADSRYEGDCFEAAVDVVVEILRAFPSDFRENERLVHGVIPLAMALGRPDADGPFRSALASADEDLLRGYCRIFTEMGESYMSLIMCHRELNQAALVDLVLDCSAISDKEIASITLHFWYRFVSWLEDLEPYEFRDHKTNDFANQLMRLLSICTSLMRYPPDIDSLTEDRVEDIHRERYYVSDTVEDCCRLLGGHIVLQSLGSRLQEECNRVSSLPTDRQLSDWHGIEACLFAIRAVARYIPDDENAIIPFVMKLIPQLPLNVPQLRETANLTIGQYAAWLDAHIDLLQPLLPYLSQGLQMPQCASAAAVAIKQLCESCNKHMSLGDPVLQLYDGIIAAQQLHQAGAAGSLLNLKDELEVLEGACKAISRQLSEGGMGPDTTAAYVNRIVQPVGTRLTALAAPNSTAGPRQAAAEVERLTVILRFLELPRAPEPNQTAAAAKMKAKTQFTMDVMSQFWTLLDAVTQKHPRDINLAEKLCRLHKHAVRGCGRSAYRPMLEPLRTQLVTNFSQSHLSPYLYCASICIAEYGRDPDLVPMLIGMFVDLSTAVFAALKTPSDFTAHPDVVEEFFFLAGRTMAVCPEPLVINPLLPSLLQCAAVGMKLDHRDANSGILTFLENVCSYGLSLTSAATTVDKQAVRQALETAIITEGQPIVDNLAQALLGDLPAYRLDNDRGSIASVLFKLNELCPQLLMQWINPALTTAPPGPKDNFLHSLANKVSRDELNTTVRQFSNSCYRNRKLRGESSTASLRHAT
mmetsp:Transcript_21609/g.44535  ORF Transcript_21609/g.44535 Transcript_21609/m.44535 type:complete len:1079 (-) Transcript_21609:1083-4319(-)